MVLERARPRRAQDQGRRRAAQGPEGRFRPDRRRERATRTSSSPCGTSRRSRPSTPCRLNVYDVLDHKWLVFSEQALDIGHGEIEVKDRHSNHRQARHHREEHPAQGDGTARSASRSPGTPTRSRSRRPSNSSSRSRSRAVRTQNKTGQGPPGRPELGQDQGLEEGLRQAQRRRENDRILRGGLTWASRRTDQSRRACATGPARRSTS